MVDSSLHRSLIVFIICLVIFWYRIFSSNMPVISVWIDWQPSFLCALRLKKKRTVHTKILSESMEQKNSKWLLFPERSLIPELESVYMCLTHSDMYFLNIWRVLSQSQRDVGCLNCIIMTAVSLPIPYDVLSQQYMTYNLNNIIMLSQQHMMCAVSVSTTYNVMSQS